MQTRSRDYASNPRSPPKKRRTKKPRKKKAQQEVSEYDFPDLLSLPPLPRSPSPQSTPQSSHVHSPHQSISRLRDDEESLIVETLPTVSLTPPGTPPLQNPEFLVLTIAFAKTPEYEFPDFTTLPPLPPPTPDELILNTASPSTLPTAVTPQSAVYKEPAENPTNTPISPKSVSELTSSISRLNIDAKTPTSPDHTLIPKSNTIIFEPFQTSTRLFNPVPVIFPQRIFPISSIESDAKMTSAAEPALQETRALQEIDRANKNLANNINFTSLSKDGSNFILWKKNTSRAMKSFKLTANVEFKQNR